MTVTALIVAAGRGSRSGKDLPKQYVSFKGRSIIAHTVDCFAGHPDIANVVVVIHPNDERLYQEAMTGTVPPPFVHGGATRQDSVLAGLEYLASTNPPDNVLIHDAARPFVSADVISRVVEGLSHAPAVLPVVALSDTIKTVSDGRVDKTIDRTQLRAAQTPQGFHFQAILSAHQQSAEMATDDASIAEAAGISVTIVDGDAENIKITEPADFELLRLRETAETETRWGTGFDVHRLGDGNSVTLCGVVIPHSGALVGHSDADVALHALTDAIFGAIGAGDIGRHFPPDDPQWAGANSRLFVEHAVSLLRARGGAIKNVDLTIICEAPKITPHAAALIHSVASMLGIAENRVSVKATTTEQLGVTGDGSGIASQALVAVVLPTNQSEDRS
jgi:2-C-methyl-D-erythritol 4-phosphate cytidylyltransferase/2-C-methyl-D-erythritol 2,4-cyclodiphosphate synthase